MSNVALLKEQYQENKEKIMELLQWTEMQYMDFQIDMGLEYMRNVLGMDDWSADYMMRSRKFWNWWRNLWNVHDANVFLMAYEQIEPERWEWEYKNSHCASFLDKHPSRVIMEDTYALMIESVNKDITRERKISHTTA